MKVREATPADAPVVARLNAVVQRLHHEAHPDRFCPPHEKATTPLFRDWLSGADQRWLPGTAVTKAWLCEDDRGEPLGYVLAVHRETPVSPFKPAMSWIQLDQIAVREDTRRCGIGNALVGAVEHWAHSLHVDTIELSVGEFNEGARRFFSALGFVALTTQMIRRDTLSPRQ